MEIDFITKMIMDQLVDYEVVPEYLEAEDQKVWNVLMSPLKAKPSIKVVPNSHLSSESWVLTWFLITNQAKPINVRWSQPHAAWVAIDSRGRQRVHHGGYITFPTRSIVPIRQKVVDRSLPVAKPLIPVKVNALSKSKDPQLQLFNA